jgi:hypothetical protein
VKNGQSEPPDIHGEIRAVGLKVRPAGEGTEARTSGHHHLIKEFAMMTRGTKTPAALLLAGAAWP